MVCCRRACKLMSLLGMLTGLTVGWSCCGRRWVGRGVGVRGVLVCRRLVSLVRTHTSSSKKRHRPRTRIRKDLRCLGAVLWVVVFCRSWCREGVSRHLGFRPDAYTSFWWGLLTWGWGMLVGRLRCTGRGCLIVRLLLLMGTSGCLSALMSLLVAVRWRVLCGVLAMA